jgi:hypothetical protein
MQQEQNEKSKIKGIHTLRAYDLSSDEAQKLDKEIKFHIETKHLWNLKGYNARYQELIGQLKKFMVRELVVENLVPTVGRTVFARRLTGDTTYTGIITHGALGSGSTAPTNSDTQLTTEVFRKVPATANYILNSVFIDFYFSKADTNGTYNEWGIFIDGTGSANSGQMFTHALTGGWSKLSTESLTITTQYVIN